MNFQIIIINFKNMQNIKLIYNLLLKSLPGTINLVCLYSGAWGDPDDPQKVFTEDDWSDIKKCQQYEKSKTLAERAAWDYHKTLPGKQ